MCYIKTLTLKDSDMLLLMMDANETLGQEAEGIINIIQNGGLVNLFTLHKCTTCVIPTFIKGTRRINYMFGTSNLIPYIAQCGYLPFHEGIISDHRGMFLDLNQSLIDNKTKNYKPPKWEIGNHCKMDQIRKYKEYITQQYQHNNIYERAERLYERAHIPFFESEKQTFLKDLNKLDPQVTEIMLRAEKINGTDPSYQSAWSEQIT